MKVIFLQLLVNVDVVEEFVAKSMPCVVDLAVLITGDIANGIPFFGQCFKGIEHFANVLFVRDQLLKLVQDGLFAVEVGPLFRGHFVTPSLFPFAEGFVHLIVCDVLLIRFVFKPDGLFSRLGCGAFFFVKRFALNGNVFLPRIAVDFKGCAHFDADSLNFRVFQQRGNTLVDLGFHGNSFGRHRAFPMVFGSTLSCKRLDLAFRSGFKTRCAPEDTKLVLSR